VWRVLSIIILLSSIFGAFGFLYSFFGFFDLNPVFTKFEPFRSFTIHEIGGHFLFGFLVGIASRKLHLGILAGLMALAIDSDHFLGVIGFHVQQRIDHSIPFAIGSAVLIGIVWRRFFAHSLDKHSVPKIKQKASRGFDRIQGANYEDGSGARLILANKQRGHFFQLVLLALSVFLSHISYYTLVGNGHAVFPLFAPFTFHLYLVPGWCALLLEAVGVLTIYVSFTNKGKLRIVKEKEKEKESSRKTS
jgi:hypothetical protein